MTSTVPGVEFSAAADPLAPVFSGDEGVLSTAGLDGTAAAGGDCCCWGEASLAEIRGSVAASLSLGDDGVTSIESVTSPGRWPACPWSG